MGQHWLPCPPWAFVEKKVLVEFIWGHFCWRASLPHTWGSGPIPRVRLCLGCRLPCLTSGWRETCP